MKPVICPVIKIFDEKMKERVGKIKLSSFSDDVTTQKSKKDVVANYNKLKKSRSSLNFCVLGINNQKVKSNRKQRLRKISKTVKIHS